MNLRVRGRLSEAVNVKGTPIFPGMLEATFAAGNPAFKQVLIHYDEGKPGLIAVIVITDGYDHITEDIALGYCRDVAKESGFSALETPLSVHIETQEWTIQNKLLTSSLKQKRKALVAKYRDVLDAMYKTSEG